MASPSRPMIQRHQRVCARMEWRPATFLIFKHYKGNIHRRHMTFANEEHSTKHVQLFP